MIDLDLDFSLLEAEFQAPACEHQQHTTHPSFHRDGNEHWVRAFYPCCGAESRVLVVCGFFLDVVSVTGAHCRHCGTLYLDASEVILDLGAVTP
ncbi:MAG: hypothetical protein ACTHJ9_14025 [Rhodanobacter sp.]